MSSSAGLVAGAGAGTGSGVLLSFLIGELLLCTRTLRASCCLGLRGGCGFVSTVSFVCLVLDELRLTTSLFSTPDATCTSVMKCESKEGCSFNDESPPPPPVTSEAEAVLFDAVNTKNSFDESPGGEDARGGGKEGLLNSNMDDSIKDATADACSSKAKAAEGEGEDVLLKGAAPAGGRVDAMILSRTRPALG